MGTTVISSGPGLLPLVFTSPTIEIKATWAGSWEVRTDLELIRWSFEVSGAGISSAEFKSRYNDKICLPGESEFRSRIPLDIRNYWVRISVTAGTSTSVVFMGIVYDDVREVRGTATRVMGHQPWVAYGPLKILQMIDVSESCWLEDSGEKHIHRLPPMNARDKRKMLVGNRSDSMGTDGVYLYGGKQVWTHGQYLAMVVKKYIQQTDGPTWSIDGQTSILEDLKTTIDFGHVGNVEMMLKKLISREYALDYKIKYTDSGFQIVIFSLLSVDSVFEDTTLVKNPDIIQIERGNQIDMIDVKIVRSRNNLCDKFRLIGRPVIICATLGGPSAEPGQVDLVPQWNPALVPKYKAGRGAGDFDGLDHDLARQSDVYRQVYQQYGPQSDWDWRAGLLSPKIGLNGQIVAGEADYQNSVRSTLSWLPLKEGVDYTTFDTSVYPPKPDDGNLAGVEPEFLPPMAFVKDHELDVYVFCEYHGIGVQVPHNEIGILLHANPNHLLAQGHWTDAELLTTEHDVKFNYEELVATIAFETSQRLQYGFDVPDEVKAHDGSTKIIYVDDAELWLLAPDTVLGLNDDGTFRKGPSADVGMTVLRDDSKRLAMLTAGAVARYANERVRSEINIRGHFDLVGLAGQMLQVVEEVGVGTNVGAPITSIEWTMGQSPGMRLKAGYA